jgi:hypothetical protein
MGEVGCEDVDWTDQVQYREQTLSVLDKAVNVRAS